MNASLISLLTVVCGFVGLVLWVYSPSRRERLEQLGHIPLDDQESMIVVENNGGESNP